MDNFKGLVKRIYSLKKYINFLKKKAKACGLEKELLEAEKEITCLRKEHAEIEKDIIKKVQESIYNMNLNAFEEQLKALVVDKKLPTFNILHEICTSCYFSLCYLTMPSSQKYGWPSFLEVLAKHVDLNEDYDYKPYGLLNYLVIFDPKPPLINELIKLGATIREPHSALPFRFERQILRLLETFIIIYKNFPEKVKENTSFKNLIKNKEKMATLNEAIEILNENLFIKNEG